MADNAAERAHAKLRGGAGATAPQVSPYRIPIRTGRYTYYRPVNRGQFDGDTRTSGPDLRQKDDVDVTERFELTDEGVNSAFGTWYSFDDSQRAELAKKMWYLGLIKDPNDFDGAYSTWKKAVEHAARFALTGREIDPRDVLDMMGDAESGPGAPKQKQGPVTSRSIDLTDPTTARAWIQQAFKQSMGRNAEDAEIRAMADALADAERAHPKVTTSTPTKWDDNGNPIDSITTTTGGMSSEAFIQNQVDADPEATAHQAAGELYPALISMLGADLG